MPSKWPCCNPLHKVPPFQWASAISGVVQVLQLRSTSLYELLLTEAHLAQQSWFVHAWESTLPLFQLSVITAIFVFSCCHFWRKKKRMQLAATFTFYFYISYQGEMLWTIWSQGFFFINCDGTHHFMFEMDLKKEDEWTENIKILVFLALCKACNFILLYFFTRSSL